MPKKYRYITNGTVQGKDKISDFRLITKKELNDESSAIRIIIPDDMKLNKCKCDNYYTTNDNRTLDELHYDIVIKFNGTWKVRNDLKPYQPYQFAEIIENEGYFITLQSGYLNIEQYQIYRNDVANKKKHEWDEAKAIMTELKNCECSVDDLDCLPRETITKILKLFVIDYLKHAELPK